MAIFLAAALSLTTAAAQEPPLPLEVQIPMLVKALTFDRKLSFREGTGLTVGVVFQGRNRESRDAGEKATRLFGESPKDKALGIFSCTTVPIDIDGKSDLAHLFSATHIDMLYVMPLSGVSIKELARAGNEARILSATSVPAYVQEGIGVGITQLAGKPRVLINLPAAKAAGADFSASLLRMATVIQENVP